MKKTLIPIILTLLLIPSQTLAYYKYVDNPQKQYNQWGMFYETMQEPRVFHLFYILCIEPDMWGTTFESTYDIGDYNIEKWEIKTNEVSHSEQYCTITNSGVHSVSIKCDLPADASTYCDSYGTTETQRYVCRQSIENKQSMCGFFINLRADEKWYGCFEPTVVDWIRYYVSEGRTKCVGNMVYECTSNHIFEPKEDCSLKTTTYCEYTSALKDVAYCQTYCLFDSEKIKEGQLTCNSNGIYVCSNTGNLEKVHVCTCLDIKECTDGTTIYNLGYEYTPPKEVPVEPPNPHPLIHFTWTEHAWGNFVSSVKNIMCSTFGIWC